VPRWPQDESCPRQVGLRKVSGAGRPGTKAVLGKLGWERCPGAGCLGRKLSGGRPRTKAGGHFLAMVLANDIKSHSGSRTDSYCHSPAPTIPQRLPFSSTYHSPATLFPATFFLQILLSLSFSSPFPSLAPSLLFCLWYHPASGVRIPLVSACLYISLGNVMPHLC
jgi:hypothetical protein